MKTFVEVRRPSLTSALNMLTLIMLTAGLMPSVLAAQESSGTWSVLNATESLHPREEASFVGCGDRLYLLGGRGIQPIDIFDPKNRRWSAGAAPPVEMHHFQAVVWMNRIYVAGAMTGRYPTEKPLDTIFIYDPEKDSWSTGDAIPQHRCRGGSGVAVYNGKLYLTAGITNGHTDGWVNWFDSYDFAARRWTELPDAPRARDHFEAGIIDGRLYAAGGRRSSAVTNQVFDLVIPEVDVFDFGKSSWATLPAKNNIPTLRAGASTVVVDKDLIVVGGESMKQLPAHADVEAFDTVHQTWRALPALSVGRHGTGTVFMNGSLFTASGAGRRGGSPLLPSIESLRIH